MLYLNPRMTTAKMRNNLKLPLKLFKSKSPIGAKKQKRGKKNWGRTILVIFALVYLLAAWASWNASEKQGEKIGFSQLVTKIQKGEVEKIIVFDNHLKVNLKKSDPVIVDREIGAPFIQALKNSGIDPKKVDFEFNNQDTSKMISDLLITLGPIILTGAIFWYFFKQAGKAQGSIFSFTKSKAKFFIKGKQSISFGDVAGLEEAKEELLEIVDFLKNPQKYRQIGARTPKGVLLVGPSGVGKTLMARAVAGEAGVPFFSMAGSEFMEVLVGIGASRVRDLFSTAKKAAPAIIFIDEIDAIGRARGMSGMGSGHDERDQTLNQILVEMDGFEPNDRVVIISATNRGDLLDPALLRPGRFDRRITINLPDIKEREAILKIHARGKPFTKNVSWKKISRRTVGFSGADLENMLNEAAILAARKNKKTIGANEIEEAALKVKLGPAKKKVYSGEDKSLTAYHESGHAIVSWFLSDTDPVQKISIVSRGMALGYTLIPPERDRPHLTKKHLVDQITSLMGGRAAEEIKFDQITTGAANDIQQATRIARAMVIEYGMSRLGPLNLGPQVDVSQWGKSYITPQEISPEMRAKVDQEIKQIIDKGHQQAKKILSQNKKKLDQLTKELIEKETLDREDFEKIMKKDIKK